MVGELKDGKILEYDIHPEDFGMSMFSNRGLKVTDPQESRLMVLEALENCEGTPREIVAKLNSAMVKVLRSQETLERLNRESLDVVASTSAQFATHLDAEGTRWAKAIEISGAKAN